MRGSTSPFRTTRESCRARPNVHYRAELLDATGEPMNRSDGTDVFTLQPLPRSCSWADLSGDSPPAAAILSGFETSEFQPGPDELHTIGPKGGAVRNGLLVWSGEGGDEAAG